MMQCNNPPPLSEDQLSTVLDGVADQAVHTHLQHCLACSRRLTEAQQLEQMLQTRLKRWDCPSSQQLGEYHLRLMDHDEARAISQHLDYCVRCVEELQTLRTFLDTNASAQTDQPQSQVQSIRERLDALIASFLPRTPALALRGTGNEPIVAVAGDITIVLDVQAAAEEQVKMIGQVTASDNDMWIGALVELRQAGKLVGTAEVDDIGGFVCGPLPTAATEVRLIAPSRTTVVLPEVPLAKS